MSQFHERPFNQRISKMGDEAEGVFEATYPEGFTRWGLNRPPINLGKVPPKIRYAPDYLTSKGFVECMGFGNDRTLKLKVDKLDAMLEWHDDFRCDLFVWDSKDRAYSWCRIGPLDMVCAEAKRASFHEGNEYYVLRAEALPVVDGWTPYLEAAA